MVRDDAGVVHPPLKALWREDGPAMGAGAAVAVAVGVASFVVATLTAATPRGRIAFTLGMMTVWIALAAAPLAAAARTRLGAVGRAGVMADASGVILLILVFAPGAPLDLLAAVKIYVLWAALAVTAGLFVGRRAHRLAVAAAVSLGILAAMAHPFWAGGVKAAPGGPVAATVLEGVDPWNAVLDAAGPAVPERRPLLEHLAPPDRGDHPGWATAALVWWSIAVLTALGGCLWQAGRRFVRGTGPATD
ncbi:MAG: hypothetical protein ACOC95_08860 [Planctomycetota bacterium]